jgi:hypothetical protein
LQCIYGKFKWEIEMKVLYSIKTYTPLGKIMGAEKEFTAINPPKDEPVITLNMPSGESGDLSETVFKRDTNFLVRFDPEEDLWVVDLYPNEYITVDTGDMDAESYGLFCADMKYLVEEKGWKLLEINDTTSKSTTRTRNLYRIK